MVPEEDAPVCARCNNGMELVTSILPVGREAGLRAYICPQCGHTSTVDIAAPDTAPKGRRDADEVVARPR